MEAIPETKTDSEDLGPIWAFDLGFSWADESCSKPFQGPPRTGVPVTSFGMAWNEISLPMKARLSGTVAGYLAMEVHVRHTIMCVFSPRFYQAINLSIHLASNTQYTTINLRALHAMTPVGSAICKLPIDS